MSDYVADNSQVSQVYGVQPFQKQTIQLGAVDRSSGELFPQYEGDYIFVHRCDFPVLLHLINQENLVGQSFMLHPGDCIRATFKGISIAHPFLTVGIGSQKLEFTIGKGCAHFVNNAENPYPSLYPPTAIVSDTALAGSFDVYLPPGARYIERLVSRIATATTLTSASWQLFDRFAVAIGGPIIAGYPVQSVAGGNADFVGVSSVFGQIEIRDVPLTVDTAYMRVTYIGTGLSQGVTTNTRMLAE